MDERQQWTYDAILARCKDLIPPLDLHKHIKHGTLVAYHSTLDGIDFWANDPADFEAELSGRAKRPDAGELPKPGECGSSFDATRTPRSANASMIGMRDDPTNWALEASLGATEGVGFREQWRPPPQPRPALLPETQYGSKRISLGFGETGKRLTFTALHASVSKRKCNVHIDERGFVVAAPDGAVITPTFWGHLANELLLKTKFRDWLNRKVGDNVVGALVVEVVNHLSLRFPDAENGFAGLEGKVNRIKGINDVEDIGKVFLPIGLTADLWHFKNSTVQANYYWHDGQQTLTLSWGGTFDKFGSK
ncbi:hypothetical protein ACMDCR_29325 [Labrys okinawensis]|uniref:hypothetical protein n=1 Tax=Labrys okinawensis TaxID=346911 RepID=UPI0039BC2DAC